MRLELAGGCLTAARFGECRPSRRYVFRFNAAAAYVQLGETERAFESLDAAFLQRSD